MERLNKLISHLQIQSSEELKYANAYGDWHLKLTRELNEQYKKWKSHNLKDYVFTYAVDEGSENVSKYKIVVKNNKVDRARFDSATIDTIFKSLIDEIAECDPSGWSYRVTFDTLYGYPTFISQADHPQYDIVSENINLVQIKNKDVID
eukprot:312984_1